MFTIRKTQMQDIDEVMQIYSNCQQFMADSGNPTQWGMAYPPREMIENDVLQGVSYVVVEDGEILAVYFYQIGTDPTYVEIEGAWIDDSEYGVVHRLAVKTRGKGVASFIMNECFNDCKSLRVDTHIDNLPMQKLLLKLGFVHCGTIYVFDGTSRIAYHKR